MTSDPAVTIRRATAFDEPAIRMLAALDSRRPPAGPLLLAEIDGSLHAVVSIRDGDAAADPFRPTADTVELLRLRARTLRAPAAPAPTRSLLTRHRRSTSTA